MISSMRTAISILLLVTACGGVGPEPDGVPEFTGVSPAVTREWFPNWVVDEGLMPSVNEAIKRWTRASCLDIQLTEGQGTIWFYVDVIPPDADDGVDPAGEVGPDLVNPLWAQVEEHNEHESFIALHELGHRLGLYHGTRGIMFETIAPAEEYIGEEALTELCSLRNCGCFNPEEPPPPAPPPVRMCQTLIYDPVTGYRDTLAPCP